MTASTSSADPTLRSALRLALLFAAIKLIVQFALTVYTTHLGYDYFRDEFYYIACGRHLAWGYVDHGPIVAVQARVGELLFGDSVFGIRILSAVAGALTIFLGGTIAWALGGRRPAQALAMIGLILCPQYIGVDGFLSMNSWEAVFWSFCILAVFLIARGAPPALWWTLFGVCAGVGMLNKPSMAFFLVALGGGLLVTRERKLLFSRWTAVALALMIVITLPFVLWQVHNHFPTLEFLHNGRVHGKNIVLNPVQFFLAQFATIGPLNALLWIPGVVALLRGRSIANARWLGLTYVFFFILMCGMHAKDYYLEGIYPAFFAAGAIAWEHCFSTSTAVQRNRIFAFPVYESLLFIFTLLILPMASPVLRPSTWVRYTTALHLPHDNTETARTGPLPQFFADRFGWNQEVAIVSRTFDSLSPEDQRRVCIFGANYGEAGAIDLLGRLHHEGLPPAMSGQNNYWLWGTHGCDPNLVIAVIHDAPQDVAQKYQSVTVVGVRDNPYAMPFEQGNIYLLRNRRASAPFHWADERFYF
ncbi:MAG TPA: glycosyltransferase family 39 protein [Acidobacteriaceae bacterium]